MAYAPHHHPVEDILNLSKSTKRKLVGGDLEYATTIERGVFASDRIPFDALLTDGEDILVDSNGDVLWAETLAIGRVSAVLLAAPVPIIEPNRLVIQSDKAWIQDIDTDLYYRLFVESVDSVASIVLSVDGFTVEPGGSPYSGDLLIDGGLAYLRNESTGLYKEWHIETVFGVPSFVLSDEDYDLAGGSGSLTTGNLIWTSGKAYLKNTTTNKYHEIFSQSVDGVQTLLISDTDYDSP